jgi:hypothetical protein
MLESCNRAATELQQSCNICKDGCSTCGLEEQEALVELDERSRAATELQQSCNRAANRAATELQLESLWSSTSGAT